MRSTRIEKLNQREIEMRNITRWTWEMWAKNDEDEERERECEWFRRKKNANINLNQNIDNNCVAILRVCCVYGNYEWDARFAFFENCECGCVSCGKVKHLWREHIISTQNTDSFTHSEITNAFTYTRQMHEMLLETSLCLIQNPQSTYLKYTYSFARTKVLESEWASDT